MAKLVAGEDWAWFEVWQDNARNVIWYKRISGPRDVSSELHSTAYLDANLFEAECDKANATIKRSVIPGDWALTQNKVDVTKWVHKHDYMVPFI